MSRVSSVSSVASSISSEESSPRAPPPASGPPTTAAHLDDDDADAYLDESFVAEHSVEVAAWRVQDAGGRRGLQDESAQDDDAYDDDAFEDSDHSPETAASEHVDRAAQDEDPVEYSDAFEYSEDFVDWNQEASTGVDARKTALHDELTELKPGDDGMVSRSIPEQSCERGTQHPGESLGKLANAWADAKLHFLKQRSRKPTRSEGQERVSILHVELPKEVSTSLLERLRKHRAPERTPVIAPVRHRGPRVPMTLVDRAHVHQLLALSSQHPPPEAATTRRLGEASARSPLSTFCSVKVADLEGKLATERLGDMCARWETSGDSDHVFSPAISEFLASALAQQRRVLRPRSDQSVLGALRTHATAMDRAVETATLAVSDSRQLQQLAHRILHAPDAHACTCSS